jgi:hypothetical protein
MPRRCHTWLAAAALCLSAAVGCGGPEKEIEDSLRQSVIFFSNFEKGVDALASAGSVLAQIDGARTQRHAAGGVVDGYLTFEADADPLRYEARGNFPYSESTWSGAVSFALQVDPAKLSAKWPEPFHIGKKVDKSLPWDDAVIFVDFTPAPRALRFGCYPDKANDVTDEVVESHVIRLDDVDWSGDEWHHVVITWANFNSGKADAEWALFVDGAEIGRKRGLRHDVTWNLDDKLMRFNHTGYVGSIDEIAVFTKLLTPGEAAYLAKPKKRLNELLKKDYE